MGKCKSPGSLKLFLWSVPQRSGAVSCVFTSWVSLGLIIGSGCSVMTARWQIFFSSWVPSRFSSSPFVVAAIADDCDIICLLLWQEIFHFSSDSLFFLRIFLSSLFFFFLANSFVNTFVVVQSLIYAQVFVTPWTVCKHCLSYLVVYFYTSFLSLPMSAEKMQNLKDENYITWWVFGGLKPGRQTLR